MNKLFKKGDVIRTKEMSFAIVAIVTEGLVTCSKWYPSLEALEKAYKDKESFDKVSKQNRFNERLQNEMNIVVMKKGNKPTDDETKDDSDQKTDEDGDETKDGDKVEGDTKEGDDEKKVPTETK